MDSIGYKQVLSNYQQQQRTLQSQQEELKRTQQMISSLNKPLYINSERVIQISADTYQSQVNGDYIQTSGSQVISRRNDQLDIYCNFDFRHINCVIENGYYVLNQGNEYYDLYALGVIGKSVLIISTGYIKLKGGNHDISFLNCENITLDNCSIVNANNSQNINITNSQNIVISYGCKNITIRNGSGLNNGRIFIDQKCENITLGENCAAFSGLITIGNQCGSQQGSVIFGDDCAKYNGHIVLEKYCGRGGNITFGKGCAAGCDAEFVLPLINVIYPYGPKAYYDNGKWNDTDQRYIDAYLTVPGVPQGKFNGGKIFVGSACATGGGSITLGDYCAYNVGRIEFGDRCASSLFESYSRGGSIILGDLCAYAGFLTFGSKCSYDCKYPNLPGSEEPDYSGNPALALIQLGACVGYSGNVSIASGCCYYGGTIEMKKFCGCSGNVIIGQQTASGNGNIEIKEGCGVESGVLKIDQICANNMGNIIIGKQCAAAGIINIGSFCAKNGNIIIGEWGAYNGGQIIIGFACQNIEMGDYCAANAGKINILEHCTDLYNEDGEPYGKITLGNNCAKNSGRITFDSMCAQGGDIILGQQCALDGGVINFGIGCASFNGEINLGDNCAYYYGRINILNLCGTAGEITLGNYCGSQNGDVILNNSCGINGQISIGDFCGVNSGKIQIGTESGNNGGKIQIGNYCGQQIGHIIIANRCAIQGGEIIIGQKCGLDGNIEIGHGCATASLVFVDDDLDEVNDNTTQYNQPGKIQIGNECGSYRGWVQIERYCCSSDKDNGGYIEINSQSGSWGGKIYIESYCAQKGQHDGTNYTTGIIKIDELCSINGGSMLIKSMNAINANIEVETYCVWDNSNLQILNSSIQNEAKLFIKTYIGTMSNSDINIGELQDGATFILGSDDDTIVEGDVKYKYVINYSLWKLQQASTKNDDLGITQYRLWNFTHETMEDIPDVKVQKDASKTTSKGTAFYIDETNATVQLVSFKTN